MKVLYLLLMAILMTTSLVHFANASSDIADEMSLEISTEKTYALAQQLANVMRIEQILVNNKEREMIGVVRDIRTEHYPNSIFKPLTNIKLKSYEQEAIESLKQVYNSKANRAAIKATYVDKLQRTYSHDELQAMIDFYKTPIGQKIPLKQNNVDQLTYLYINELFADRADSDDLRSVTYETYIPMINQSLEEYALKESQSKNNE